MAGCSSSKSTFCQLRVNWVLAILIPPTLYSISTLGYLTSFHRFVTNPRRDSINKTLSNDDKILPGLGESDFFYSFLISMFYAAACTGTLLTGFLVRCIPYWYLYVIATCSHILGYVIYGTATQGWQLVISQLLAGYYCGSEYSLSFCYVTDSSARYAQLKRDSGVKVEDGYDDELRHKLLGYLSIGYLLGFPIGPGVAVLFTYLNVDQFHSIAWFNVAFGLGQLLLIVFFFRGESNCKKIGQCKEFFSYRKDSSATSSRPTALQLLVIVSMLTLSLVDMFKSGIIKTLLNPILSDSFGLSLKYSSFVYLALTVPRLMGSVTLILLQRMKFRIKSILLIGVLVTMTAYALLTDWQSIPYDPCTEYSPFHHPGILNQTRTTSTIKQSMYSRTMELNLFPQTGSPLDSNRTQYPGYSATCELSSSCPLCSAAVPLHQKLRPCLVFTAEPPGNSAYLSSEERNFNDSSTLRLSCSNDMEHFCINLQEPLYLHEEDEYQIHVLTESQLYYIASNSCENADVPGRHCHWIPFSIITNTVCNDCPPICRAREQTLSIVQFSIGLFALLVGTPVFWIPLLATATDYSPKKIRGIVIGFITTSNLVAQSLTPLILDKIYEETQKRTFAVTLTLIVLHIPFVIEIVILNFCVSVPKQKPS